VIDKVSFDDGFARYELGGLDHESRHRHHHAICSRCGNVFSFQGDLLDTLEQALLDRTGFFVTDHEVKLHGYCRECREAMEEEQNGKS
jgi:Fur family ferric uptake transcriptional regulator